MKEKSDLKVKRDDKVEKKYTRTLQFIFIKATLDLYPNSKITIQHSIGKGIFGEVFKEKPLDKNDIKKIKDKMQELIKRDLPINKVNVTREKAIEIFKSYNMEDKVLLLNQIDLKEIELYELDGRYDYFYGPMNERTSEIKGFDLIDYENGFILRRPTEYEKFTLSEFVEQRKMRNVFRENEKWLDILEVGNVGSLNKKFDEGELVNLIMISEALHEKKIAEIADKISEKNEVKLVLISGPSSSGKTTFAQRLGIQLRLNGIKPVTISVDNYFVERSDTPKDENGEYDFESIEAIDLKLFNEHLVKLLNGEEIEMPRFDFHEGTKKYKGDMLKLNSDEILVIEGIHCLNDKLTSQISKDEKYKVYISALTVLNMDRYNRISTTDTRLVRRIVRDYQFRGYSAKHTLDTWASVNRGEEKNIFPYQEDANKIFNTSLIYELSALKDIAKPLLEEITQDEKEYAEAQRLLNILKYFESIPNEEVPTNSLLKEFLGGGNFKY